ncbi:GerAB/ArcD/ProY family transporter [Paenibacillus faecalis]|uniref:GerAB/ArcD/ProY family transporter n=1 Tax=Paenibacillus faecalis TaxID=2079532 RepID=UPI000D0F6A60|nr:endospore germination permease [Paenibacillus faecalis]
MTNIKQISTLNIYFIMLLALGITNHVIMIPALLQSAGRDAWFGVLVTIVIQIAWVYIIYFIMKRTNQEPIFTWFKQRFGSTLTWIFTIITVVYFFIMAMIILRETTTWLNVSYLPQTPKIAISISIILLCVYIANNGIRSIAIISGVLLPFVWILGHFVAIANMQYKDYSLLTPLFVEGYRPTLNSVIVASGGFMELIVLIFIQQYVSRKLNYLSVVMLSVLLGGLTIGPLMGAISSFGATMATQLRYPAFEQWMLVTITKYVTHVDFLALYQWMSGSLIRISLFLLIISNGIPIKKPKWRLLFLFILGALLTGISLIPRIDKEIEQYTLGKYSIISLVFLSTLTLMIALFTTIKVKTRKR